MDKYVLSLLVEDQPGVTSRISGLFTRRGYNIESFSSGSTELPGMTRITLVLKGDKEVLEQIQKQLGKLVDVVSITELKPALSVYRELALIKVNTDEKTRASIIEVVEIFRGKVIDVATDCLILEVTGDHNKIQAFIELMEPYGIREIVRTGLTALGRRDHK
ncbi:acetolactate synthase small subunit [Tindallia californiensis]|uniref:Acetolactate synthase small subunit n=1 Tax=Tindallia californiensis TaxID=159292 RepID=A0A1H3JTD2_9FIRM|nr:acetolactate synthase small subunit [Tindallia californiensis]SDY43162.1 acetolactate synthase, small subunit [Tindallia californiensis]